MKKVFFIYFLLVFCTLSGVFAQNSDDNSLNQKYDILIKKGIKLGNNGDFGSAAVTFQEAYDISKNIEALVLYSSIQTQAGNYPEAIKILKEVSNNKLSDKDQSEVSYLLGRIYSSSGKYNIAAKEFGNSIKKSPKKGSAKVRLSLLNIMNGMYRSSEELLSKDEFNEENGYTPEDYRICFAVDMHNGYFGRAYDTCKIISAYNSKGNSDMGILYKFLNLPFMIFFCFLPLLLNKTFFIVYFFILFSALSVTAIYLSKSVKWWHILIFIVGSVSLLFISKILCMKDIYICLLNAQYYLFDGVWILPKTIMASHFISYSLFLIFPCFLLLRENMRPVAYELYGIWFFCFFFGIFVLSFQCGNINIIPRLSYMIISLILSIFAAMTMPLAKLLFFKISQVKGFSFLANFINSSEVVKGSLSYTDIKILENKMWLFIDKGEITQALSLGKKVLNKNNRNDFPSFWLGLICAQIFNEDYELATMNINDFYKVFQESVYRESCQVYEAYLKSEKGDFATAYKLINSISDERAKSLTSNEAAISLLILARCCLNSKDNVQAHINYTKALNCVKSNFFKLIILTDVAYLDIVMNAKQAMQKWKTLVSSIPSSERNSEYINTIMSMVVFSENKTDEAISIASKNLNEQFVSGKSIFWYGHLLCFEGKFFEAEELLEKMKSGTYNAEQLMTEVTSTHNK